MRRFDSVDVLRSHNPYLNDQQSVNITLAKTGQFPPPQTLLTTCKKGPDTQGKMPQNEAKTTANSLLLPIMSFSP